MPITRGTQWLSRNSSPNGNSMRLSSSIRKRPLQWLIICKLLSRLAIFPISPCHIRITRVLLRLLGLVPCPKWYRGDRLSWRIHSRGRARFHPDNCHSHRWGIYVGQGRCSSVKLSTLGSRRVLHWLITAMRLAAVRHGAGGRGIVAPRNIASSPWLRASRCPWRRWRPRTKGRKLSTHRRCRNITLPGGVQVPWSGSQALTCICGNPVCLPSKLKRSIHRQC